MATIEWLSSEIKSKNHAALVKASTTCIKSGHDWETLDQAAAGKSGETYVAYCRRCLKAKTGTTVEWPAES